MSVPVKSPELQKKVQGRSPLKGDWIPAGGKIRQFRMGALKKAVMKALITAALLGTMSFPVCAYMDADSTAPARVYMEETAGQGTVDSPESSVTVWIKTQEENAGQGTKPVEGTSRQENSEPESPFSVPGNGEVLDEIRSSSDKDFYAIQTQNHNTFYLVVDHASSSDNVYMLSTIDENDLEEFLKEKKEPEPEPVIVEEPVTEPEEPAEPEPKKKSGGMGWLIFLVLAAAGAIGGYYYFRFYRPSLEEDDVESENMEYSDTRFPTENEDDVEES